MNQTRSCKRCLRPYVNAFTMEISFPFCETKISWEGCADCAYQIKRQTVDFMLKVAQPPRRIQRKLMRKA